VKPLQLDMSATSKSKLMPFIYFTAKTSQELARLGALLLELSATQGYNTGVNEISYWYSLS
jgi:hypothetical protein